MKVYRNIKELLTLSGAHKKNGRNLLPQDCGVIENGSVVFDENQIHWVGKSQDLPEKYISYPAEDLHDFVMTPALVDSHTHLVFSGNRAHEYAQRLNGVSYQDLFSQGGGIQSTVRQTQKASKEELFAKAFERIEKMYQWGVSTIEIKTGYGLNIETEKILLEVICELKKTLAPKVEIFTTYMAAHAIPQNVSGEEYIDQTVIPLLKEIKSSIDAVDIFHEIGYFSELHVRKLFDFCLENNIPRKIHADEFQDNSGLSLALEYDCLSADHLLRSHTEAIKKMKDKSTVATLLPGTGLFLGKDQANARLFLDSGAKVALASDFNPGSCHCPYLPLIAFFSAPTLQLNQCELWSSITLNAAHALGKINQGAIVPGLRPRFTKYKTSSLDSLTYCWGENFCDPF